MGFVNLTLQEFCVAVGWRDFLGCSDTTAILSATFLKSDLVSEALGSLGELISYPEPLVWRLTSPG